MIPYENDGRDHYRKEYNDMLLEKASHASGMIRDLYITVTITRKAIRRPKAISPAPVQSIRWRSPASARAARSWI